MNRLTKIIFFGFCLGIWLIISPFMVSLFLLIMLVYFIVYHYVPQEERNFIIIVFTIGLLTRMIFSFLYYYLYLARGNYNFIAPDSDIYLQNALNIFNILTKEGLSNQKLPPINEYQIGLHTYLMALMYKIFGYTPLGIPFINSILSASSAILVYDISKNIFDTKAARLAMVLVMFFPSLFIFSTMNLKDPLINFILILIIWNMTRFLMYSYNRYLITVFILAFFVSFFRRGLSGALILIFSVYLGGIFVSKLTSFRKILIYLLVLFIFIMPAVQKSFKSRVNALSSIHFGYSSERGAITNYKFFPERFYQRNERAITGIQPIEVLVSLFKALGFILLSPFLWDVKSKNILLSFPQVTIWYILLFFSFIGIIKAIRYNFFKAFGLLLFLWVITLLLALSSGNIGTVFRHRDMVTPIYLIFSAVGLEGLFTKWAKT